MRNSLWYGGSILLIYLLASLPFHLLTGIDPQFFNGLATSVVVNTFFFGVLLAFALSLFGLFEIRLPARLTNGAGAKGSVYTRMGIFFLALTLTLVSFSCTGPLLGTLLVNSVASAGGAWQLTAAMAGFGLALAAPFTLLALFPQALKGMPKSGDWLNTVKRSLAFIELALALKFLSNADLVGRWGLLKREVFIAIWALLSLALGIYLLRGLRKKKVMPVPVGRGGSSAFIWPQLFSLRVTIGVGALVFAAYLLTSLTPAGQGRLSFLGGFPPPLSYSMFGKKERKEVEPLVVNDYEKALQLARKQAKPLLIDFTGWACINCRKMEEKVWRDPQVAQTILERFVLVSLYVDDRQPLPLADRFIYRTKSGEFKAIRTQGDKWSTFQAENFGQLSQPLYVQLSPEGRLLNHPIGYTASVKAFQNWLHCGLAAFGNTASNRNADQPGIRTETIMSHPGGNGREEVLQEDFFLAKKNERVSIHQTFEKRHGEQQ